MDIQEELHPAWAEVDIGALAGNLAEIRRRVGPDVDVMASVKADAYGHGAVSVARALGGLGVTTLMTGCFEEAVAMRRAGIDARIVIFGSNLPVAATELARHDLIPTVYNIETAQVLSATAPRPTPVFIKVDCGLGRLGIPLDEAADFVGRVSPLPNVIVEGVYTHVPFSDAEGRDWAAGRLAAFDNLVDRLADTGPAIAVTQARASAHVLAGLNDRCNAVCVGFALYGLSPVTRDVSDLAGFTPVLRAIRARLIHVGHHSAGADIAVGGQYGLKNAQVTGVIPLGMTDGMRGTAAGNVAMVLMRGRRVPVMGVSLEHTTLDLGGIDTPCIGEEVTVLGADGSDRITIDEMAAWLGRTNIEVVMTFSRRLPFRYVDTP